MKNTKDSAQSILNHLSGKKKLAFRIVLILFPILFMIILEFTLRLFSYGGTLDLFIPGSGPLKNHYTCNPDMARRYFAGTTVIPTPANDYFRQHKPANSYRVFVVGGSTTNGYPYGANLMFSRILQEHLKATLPRHIVEVVNVSTAAINSYTVLDFLDDILAQEPDLILLYAGHNEFYGALGVASMINFGRSRMVVLAYLKLLKFKTFLAVRDVALALKNLGQEETTAPTATLMQRIVAEPSIPVHSDLYSQGVEQFRGNLKAILKKTTKAGVPMMLSDVVSNTSDLPPFISAEGSPSALSLFEKARELADNGEFAQAKIEFEKARDLDALRFRAPSEFNAIIHDCAQQYGATLVPMQAAFEAASPSGLVGDNLFIDHLHPNINGYHLMARTFYTQMLEHDILPIHESSTHQLETLYTNRGYTKLDSLYGEFNIKILKSGWPFTPEPASITVLDDIEPNDIVEEMAIRVAKYDNVSLLQGHSMLAENFEKMGNVDAALAEYQAMVALKSFSARPYLKVAEALLKAEQPQKVPPLIETSLLFDESPLPYILLGEAYNGMAKYYDAISAFQQAQQLGAPAHDPHIILGLTYAYRETGQFEKLKTVQGARDETLSTMQQTNGDAHLYQLLQRADQLIQANEFDAALSDLKNSLRLRETAQAHTWIGQIYMEKKQLDLALQHLENARAMGSTEPLMLYNLCIVLYQQKEYTRAQAILRELESLAPAFGDPYELKTKIQSFLAR